MSPETRSWLRSLDALGDVARQRVTIEGTDPAVAVKDVVDRSVDPLQPVDWLRLCSDLKIKTRPNIFAAQVELAAFSKSVIEEMLSA